jgi:hypothetical protein
MSSPESLVPSSNDPGLAPLLWVPLAIVAVLALYRVDLYSSFGLRWVAAILVVGLVLMDLVALVGARLAMAGTCHAAAVG